jgi:hypothetical protein
MAGKRNLVVVRAGPNSLHRAWTARSGPKPSFDLLVAAYDPSAIDADNDHIRHMDIPGTKVAGWGHLFTEHPGLLDEYEAIALIDDDIETTVAAIEQCFDMGRKYNLAIWQPGLSADSHITYAASLANPRLDMRFVNCIEMMCPFFSADILRAVAPLFSLGFESGLDLVWCSLAHGRGLDCAVIDRIAVRHTRPVGQKKQENGFSGGRIYEDDIYAFLKLFDMEWPSWVALRAIDRNGRTLTSKISLTMHAAAPFVTWQDSPRGARSWRMKAASIHLRHQMMRSSYYGTGVEEKIRKMFG